MDKRMPGLDGLAATRALRASPLGRDARILIISADALGTSETEWRSAGADGFIAKPFRNEELLGQIGALLGLEPVYAAPPAAAVPRPVLAAEAVAQLADGVRAEMVKAVEVGDLDRLLVLVARDVVPLHPALGQALNQLAASFDYDTLLQALKREEQHD